MCLLPPAEQTITEDFRGLVYPDLEWWNARLRWTNAIPPLGRQPTIWEAQEYWNQCKLVPREAWYNLSRKRKHTFLTCGQPLTDLGELDFLRGKLVTYPDGQVFRYEDLPGLGDPSFRLDKLTWTTSVKLVGHEVGHAVDTHLFNRDSDTVRFRRVWERLRHTLPNTYIRTIPAEAWAEAFAVWGLFHDRPNEFPWNMDFWHYFNHICIVERRWSFWSQAD